MLGMQRKTTLVARRTRNITLCAAHKANMQLTENKQLRQMAKLISMIIKLDRSKGGRKC